MLLVFPSCQPVARPYRIKGAALAFSPLRTRKGYPRRCVGFLRGKGRVRSYMESPRFVRTPRFNFMVISILLRNLQLIGELITLTYLYLPVIAITAYELLRVPSKLNHPLEVYHRPVCQFQHLTIIVILFYSNTRHQSF